MLDLTSWLSTLKVPGKPDEFEAKALLASRGIHVPRGKILTPQEIEDGLWQDPGLTFPCVAKVCDPEILHKTDRGGLELGLISEDWRERVTALGPDFPEAASSWRSS